MGAVRQLLRVAGTALRDGPGPLLVARRAIRDFGAIQRTWELQALLGEVRRLRPSTVVEIGSHRGGTLVCWTAVAAATARIVSIDMPTFDGEWSGLGEEDLARVRRYLAPGQTLTAISADSHASETKARLEEILAGAPVDLLWIDGDHTFDGVKQDFEMYRPLVRPGGLVGFHDVAGADLGPGFGSTSFWELIKTRYDAHEYVAESRPGSGMGIGVLRI